MDKIFNYLNKNNLVDVFNIGNSKPVSIKYLLQCIENELGVKAKANIKKLSISEMNSTNCDISKFKKNSIINPIQKLKMVLGILLAGIKLIKDLINIEINLDEFKITVIITTYNSANTLIEFINSILNQTFSVVFNHSR